MGTQAVRLLGSVSFGAELGELWGEGREAIAKRKMQPMLSNAPRIRWTDSWI